MTAAKSVMTVRRFGMFVSVLGLCAPVVQGAGFGCGNQSGTVAL
jgi:hypothetical protein